MEQFDQFIEISAEFLRNVNWLFWVPVVICAWYGLRLFVYFARILKRKLEKNKLLHLRVTLPRNDSKLDNEKRTEKDFHEVIGNMEQLFRSLHEMRDLNLYNMIFNRWIWKKPLISYELQFENREMSFVIVCHPYYLNLIQKQVTTFYESAEIEFIEPEKRLTFDPKKEETNGYYMYTAKDFWYPIQTYKKIENDALNGLANSFAKLQPDEKAVIQILTHPVSNYWQERANEVGTAIFKEKKIPGTFKIPILSTLLKIIFLPLRILIKGYDPETDNFFNDLKKDSGGIVRMLSSNEEVAKAIGEKSQLPGFHTTIRVMASSPRKERTNKILNGFFIAFNIFQAKGMNLFEYRRIVPLNLINKPWILHNFNNRLPAFFEKSNLLSSEELATMFHFPDAKYNKIPTIKWLTYKVLPPPINLPEEGVVLGKSVYRGVEKFVHFKKNDRTRHQYIIGKSGSGKSVLLWNQAVQDIANGEGVCVIDPHGDLIEDIAACVPKERAKDTIIFDPGDKERPMGLNILETKTMEERDRASLDAMEIFIKLFGNEIFGPRIQHYFRNGCLTLMADEDEGATLIDIPRLFIDDDFQNYKVSKVANPVVRSFWENEMANTGDREKQEMIPYFTSKFGPFVTNTTMRNIIGQTKSAFNLREAMDNGKVVLINLSKGKIGGINAQLLGLIVVSKITQAAMGRADTAAEDRKDFYLYVDEFQNFASDSFATILSEARKYRLNLIMAHQYIAQLSEGAGGISVGQKDSKIKNAVFGNVGSMMSFKIGADDAEYFAKEYAPLLSQQDILSIANYKAYLKLNIDNTTSRPFSMETLYDPSKKNKKVSEILKKYSRMKYGRKKEFVDAEIEARMGIDNLNAINSAASADPTVDDNLLSDKPVSADDNKLSTAVPMAQQMPAPVPAAVANNPNHSDIPKAVNSSPVIDDEVSLKN